MDEIKLNYGLDNVSIDENGDLWIAAFPVGIEIYKANKDPYNAHPPSAVLRVRKVDGEWKVDKVLEDKDGEVLPAATTALHDAKTGRIFLSSKLSFNIDLDVTNVYRCYFTVDYGLRGERLRSQMKTEPSMVRTLFVIRFPLNNSTQTRALHSSYCEIMIT